MFETKENLLMAINKCLPYPDQITDLDFSSNSNSIYFTWRKTNHFKIGINGSVEVIDGCFSSVSDICIIFRELLKHQYISDNY